MGDVYIYHSRDSNYLVFWNHKTGEMQHCRFMHDFEQYEKSWRPYSVNFGILNDSTLVVAYANNWPYKDECLMLLNINSKKITYPFKMDTSLFVSKHDTSARKFFVAVNKNKAWFLYRTYTIPVISQDTTIFIPVYTGVYSLKYGPKSKLKPLVNSVLPITTHYNKNSHPVDIHFSQVDSVFNDSINQKDDFEDVCNMTLYHHDTSGFIISFYGSIHLVEYNYRNASSTTHRLQFPEIPVEEWKLSMNSEKLSETVMFYEAYTSPGSPYIFREIAQPVYNTKYKNQREYRCFLYDKQYKLKGVFEQDFRDYYIRWMDGDKLVNFNQTKSAASTEWLWFDLLETVKTNRIVAMDSAMMFDLKSPNKNQYNLSTYLHEMHLKPEIRDSIPVLICDYYCPTCTHKIGSFIQTVQAMSLKHAPFILYAKDTAAMTAFIKTYHIQPDSNILFDRQGSFNRLNYGYNLGLILQRPYADYYFSPMKAEDVEMLLKLICPEVKIVNGFCVPVKN